MGLPGPTSPEPPGRGPRLARVAGSARTPTRGLAARPVGCRTQPSGAVLLRARSPVVHRRTRRRPHDPGLVPDDPARPSAVPPRRNGETGAVSASGWRHGVQRVALPRADPLRGDVRPADRHRPRADPHPLEHGVHGRAGSLAPRARGLPGPRSRAAADSPLPWLDPQGGLPEGLRGGPVAIAGPRRRLAATVRTGAQADRRRRSRSLLPLVAPGPRAGPRLRGCARQRGGPGTPDDLHAVAGVVLAHGRCGELT